jgi:hypothetical protein
MLREMQIYFELLRNLFELVLNNRFLNAIFSNIFLQEKKIFLNAFIHYSFISSSFVSFIHYSSVWSMEPELPNAGG